MPSTVAPVPDVDDQVAHTEEIRSKDTRKNLIGIARVGQVEHDDWHAGKLDLSGGGDELHSLDVIPRDFRDASANASHLREEIGLGWIVACREDADVGSGLAADHGHLRASVQEKVLGIRAIGTGDGDVGKEGFPEGRGAGVVAGVVEVFERRLERRSAADLVGRGQGNRAIVRRDRSISRREADRWAAIGCPANGEMLWLAVLDARLIKRDRRAANDIWQDRSGLCREDRGIPHSAEWRARVESEVSTSHLCIVEASHINAKGVGDGSALRSAGAQNRLFNVALSISAGQIHL